MAGRCSGAVARSHRRSDHHPAAWNRAAGRIEMTHRRMLMLIGSAAVALVVVGVVPAAAQTRRDSGFRAAAAKVDITPETSQWLSGYQPRRSEGIHDRIYHRVVALESGDTQFFLISSDLCLFSPTFYDRVSRDLEK